MKLVRNKNSPYANGYTPAISANDVCKFNHFLSYEPDIVSHEIDLILTI